MPQVPTAAQLVLLGLATISFAIGWFASLARIRFDRNAIRLIAKSLVYVGITLAIAVLVWHGSVRGSWIPLEDNFDALIWLGLLLAIFVQYVQFWRPLGGLDWFVIPIVIVLLIAAAVYGRANPHKYLKGAWAWTHIISSFAGLFALVIGGISGVMYLMKLRQLRNKSHPGGPKIASLERLEHVTYASVTLGFALLTVGLVTGLVRVLTLGGATSLGDPWYANPKVILAFSVWLVYAVVLHAPINPSFRGRRAAILSVCGLVLTIGTLIAIQYVPQASSALRTSGGGR